MALDIYTNKIGISSPIQPILKYSWHTCGQYDCVWNENVLAVNDDTTNMSLEFMTIMV